MAALNPLFVFYPIFIGFCWKGTIHCVYKKGIKSLYKEVFCSQGNIQSTVRCRLNGWILTTVLMYLLRTSPYLIKCKSILFKQMSKQFLSVKLVKSYSKTKCIWNYIFNYLKYWYNTTLTV